MDAVTEQVIDKAETLVQQAAGLASNAFDAVQNVIVNAVTQYGPSVVDALLWVVRIDALQHLASGWIPILLAIVAIRVSYKKFMAGGERIDQLRAKEGQVPYSQIVERVSEIQWVMVGWASVIATALLVGALSFKQVTNVWYYVAVAKPELYLAKQAVDLTMAKLGMSQQ